MPHKNTGISNAGVDSEARFRWATGATKSSKSALGDAMLYDHYVEVKKASGGTVNQVRAAKYLPHVIHDPRDNDQWYVIPADEVARLVASKKRGQHNENPFECASISVSKISKFKVERRHLRQAVKEAIDSANANTDMRAKMTSILQEQADLADRHKKAVQALFDAQAEDESDDSESFKGE